MPNFMLLLKFAVLGPNLWLREPTIQFTSIYKELCFYIDNRLLSYFIFHFTLTIEVRPPGQCRTDRQAAT